jgi:hypothetical protein
VSWKPVLVIAGIVLALGAILGLGLDPVVMLALAIMAIGVAHFVP